MHVAFLTSEYPHLNTGHGGGIGTSIRNLTPELVKLGCCVTVFVYGQKQQTCFWDCGVRVVTIERRRYGWLTWYLYRKYIAKVVNRHVATDGIDVVEAVDWSGVTAFMKLKVPLILKFHGSDRFFCHLDRRPQKWKNRWFESVALKRADGYLPVSGFVRNETFRLFGLDAKIPCCVVHNGVDIERFNVGEMDRKDKIILYFGTLIRKKGCLEIPFIFNRIIEQVPDAKLVLVGGDSYDILTQNESTFALMKERFTQEALPCVTYVGKVPYCEVQRYIRQASISLFPSYGEAFPVSWLEAMACGKAIVASNIGWGSEMIENNVSGILIHPADTDGYANKICELLNDADYARFLALNARRRVETLFDIKIVAKQSLAFYEKMKRR